MADLESMNCSTLSPQEKELMKWRKKLREIQKIEERVARGEKVDELQKVKLTKKKEVEALLPAAVAKKEADEKAVAGERPESNSGNDEVLSTTGGGSVCESSVVESSTSDKPTPRYYEDYADEVQEEQQPIPPRPALRSAPRGPVNRRPHGHQQPEATDKSEALQVQWLRPQELLTQAWRAGGYRTVGQAFMPFTTQCTMLEAQRLANEEQMLWEDGWWAEMSSTDMYMRDEYTNNGEYANWAVLEGEQYTADFYPEVQGEYMEWASTVPVS